jgi:hypothetical protein
LDEDSLSEPRNLFGSGTGKSIPGGCDDGDMVIRLAISGWIAIEGSPDTQPGRHVQDGNSLSAALTI